MPRSKIRPAGQSRGKRAHVLALLLAGAWLAAGTGMARAQEAQQPGALPPPPRAPVAIEAPVLHLELVVNRLATGQVVPVAVRDGRHFVAASDLRAAGVPVEGSDDATVEIEAMPGVETSYDAGTLRLMIDLPPAWLPRQRIGRDRLQDHVPAQSSFGALLNYEAYAADPDRGPASLSAFGELRVFGGFGAFSTTGAYQRASGGFGRRGLLRYDTRWRHSDERRMLTYEAGDIVTNSLGWGSAVRLGGVQVARDFTVRPDVITYPLPQFAGEAAVPTTLDLFINGYRADSASLRPGPFTLTNVPFINGAGQAVVVTTDALGRQVSTTIPFYVSSALLRRGLSDFSMAAGAVRRRYGQRSFAYGTLAASGAFRHGVSDHLTLEASAEAADSLWLAGLGGVLRLGNFGIASAAASHSRFEGRGGTRWTLGYQYSARAFNLAVLHSRRSRDFADLAVVDQRGFSLPRQTTSATASVSMGRRGSLGIGYFDSAARDGTRTRLANASWGLPLWGNASLHASGNYEIERGDWSTALQLVVPLGVRRGSATATVERDRSRGAFWRANYSRAIPSQGGFGWNLGYADGEHAGRFLQADLAWRNDRIELRGGAYGTGGDHTRWANVRGALVAMDGSLFAANRISDAFAVVSTNGQPGVPVRYENQLVGKTDRNGRLLVPWASSYYRAKYTIDPLGLPANVEAPLVEQRVAVRRGSGYRLEFPVSRIVAASVTLHDAAGAPLPPGSEVTANGAAAGHVGWDGITYLEGLRPRNILVVRLPEGETCRAAFALDTGADQVARIGPLRCMPESEP